MRHIALFTPSVLLVVLACSGYAQERAGRQSLVPSRDQTSKAVNDAPSPEDNASAGQEKGRRTFEKKPSAEEDAIRETAKKYIEAFSSGDAKAAAKQYASDAEYIDPQGIRYEGRQAIEDLLTTFFANYPDRKIDFAIDSIRLVSPIVAIEDGTSIVTTVKDQQPQTFQYTAVHVKIDGQWLTASVRDHALGSPRQHRAQIGQLEWMIGDWVHEGDDAVVHFSCRAVDNGHFLVRKFTVQVAGQETMTGTQRIGWDPQAGKFRAWVFDSDGGFSEGFWRHEGDEWTLKLSGVTADGRSASCTSIYSFVDNRTMTFRSIHHEVGGIELPDSAAVRIVRQPPQAESAQ